MITNWQHVQIPAWGVLHPLATITSLAHCVVSVLPQRGCRGRDIVQQKKQELQQLIEAEGLVPVGDVKL